MVHRIYFLSLLIVEKNHQSLGIVGFVVVLCNSTFSLLVHNVNQKPVHCRQRPSEVGTIPGYCPHCPLAHPWITHCYCNGSLTSATKDQHQKFSDKKNFFPRESGRRQVVLFFPFIPQPSGPRATFPNCWLVIPIYLLSPKGFSLILQPALILSFPPMQN